MGKVLRPHGLRGVLRIRSYAQSIKSFKKGQCIFLRLPDGREREYTLSSLKPHKNLLLMKLREIGSIDEAETLREGDIFIRKADLIKKRPDEFYWYELIGTRVYLSSGKYLGCICNVMETGSNDVYFVRTGDREILIPAIYDVVKKIDVKKKEMIIDPFEGLLDLNEV